jgi:hypothetical protein
MKRHAGSPGSTTREQRRAAAKKQDRERHNRRAKNIRHNNLTDAQRERLND